MTQPPTRGWTKEYDALAVANGRVSWQTWADEVEAARGHPVCGRKTLSRSKNPGTPCPRRPGKNGTGACAIHGDKNPAGIASPTYKHGGYSESPRAVGRSLRQRLEEAQEQDPRRLLALGATALLARFDELVDRIDAGSSGPETIARARDLLVRLRAATDAAEMSRLLNELEQTVRAGAATDEAWSGEFYRLVNLMGLHAERYRRVQEAAGEYVERERAVMLFQRFGQDVVQAIDEAELPTEAKVALRRRIAGIVIGYLNRPALPAVVGA